MNAAISTLKANSGGARAAKVREEGSLDLCGWPCPGAETGAGPGAAAQALGPLVKVHQDSFFHENLEMKSFAKFCKENQRK